MIVALIAAVAAAFVYGGGSILQAVGVRRSSQRGRGVLGAALQLAYLAGLGCDLVAWGLSLVALRRLPVFVVQSVLAGSLAVTVVLAAVTIGTTLRRRDAYAVAATVAALAVIGASGGSARAPSPSHDIQLGLVLGTVAIGVAVAAACRWASPSVVAALAGLAFGNGALAARAVPAANHLTGYLREPLAWVLVVGALVGTYAYAFALDHGDVGVATAVLWVSELVAPGLVGVVLLGDEVRPGWTVPALLASIVAVGAIVALARAVAVVETTIELEDDVELSSR